MATNTAATRSSSVPSSQNTLARTLQNIDSYLAESKYPGDHPWRLEIARGLAKANALSVVTESITFDLAYGELKLSSTSLEDQANMRARQLRGLLFFMHGQPNCEELLALAYELSADLAGDIARRDFGVLRATQLARLLLLVQDDEGPDDMLWLSQQFADEILQVLTSLSTSQEVVA